MGPGVEEVVEVVKVELGRVVVDVDVEEEDEEDEEEEEEVDVEDEEMMVVVPPPPVPRGEQVASRSPVLLKVSAGPPPPIETSNLVVWTWVESRV